MSAQKACLNDEQLRALLVGAMPELERREWEAHLTECIRCRERLDALTGDEEPWRGKAPPLSAAADSQPLREAMARLKAGGEAPRAGSEPVPPPLGTKIRYLGDYELLEELGRGGMGIVFRARQLSLRREVALKVILAGQLASPADVRRFQFEAEAAARLDYPHIVPTYEFGEHDGHHFFSMKLVEGCALSERMAKEGLPIPMGDAAKLLATIARAVHYAHQHGVLHRDLQPGNILLDRAGVPHVMDFGLAKLLERGSSLTRSAAIMGTPNYIAPEVAAGQAREATTAVDVYSLGAILYELLTGQPPFQADSPAGTLRLVLEANPVSPVVKNPSVPSDLATISETDSAWLWDVRLRQPLAILRRMSIIPRYARFSPDGRLLVVVDESSTARVWDAQSGSFQSKGMYHGSDGEMFDARFSPDGRRLLTSSENRTVQMWDPFTGNPIGEPWPQPRSAQGIRFSPDGKWVVTASGDGIARLMDSETGRPFVEMRHSNRVHSAEFSADGRMIATASADATARIWEAATGRPLGEPLRHDAEVYYAEFDRAAQRVVTSSKDKTARIWSVQTGQMLTPPLVHADSLQSKDSVTFNPNGSRVATAAGNAVQVGILRLAIL